MKFVSVAAAVLATCSGVLAGPMHEGRVDNADCDATHPAQWLGPIARDGEAHPYYGNAKDVGMKMVRDAKHHQHHHGGKLGRRSKDGIVCDRVDQPRSNYGETWAAYKLAAVLSSLSATNQSGLVAIGAGYGHCVDMTDCSEADRARISLCNDNDEPLSVPIKTIAEYSYQIIAECGKEDDSGLIWGQQFDDDKFNVIIAGCPAL